MNWPNDLDLLRDESWHCGLYISPLWVHLVQVNPTVYTLLLKCSENKFSRLTKRKQIQVSRLSSYPTPLVICSFPTRVVRNLSILTLTINNNIFFPNIGKPHLLWLIKRGSSELLILLRTCGLILIT